MTHRHYSCRASASYLHGLFGEDNVSLEKAVLKKCIGKTRLWEVSVKEGGFRMGLKGTFLS